jgi:hypothetical protein
MDREQAHKLVDQIFDRLNPNEGAVEFTEESKRELPKDKRVVRTKSTGDRVYLLDETAKTKAWVTSPEILEKLGFTLNDVQDIEDSMMLGYAMIASLYRVED